MEKIGFIIILLLILFPYKDSGQHFDIQKEEEIATIVIYVKSGRQFSSFDLLFNDVPVISSLPKNTFFIIKHRPGKVSLKTRGKMLRNLIEEREYSLTTVAGSTYYLEAMMEYQVLMTSMHLIRRSSQVGENEILNMKGEVINLLNP